MRSLFLVNPKAHRVATRGSVLMGVSDEMGTPLHLLDAHYKPTGSADRIYIEGGDGTISWVLSKWLESGLTLPNFVIVKGGTTDQIAGIVGLRRRTSKGITASLSATLDPVTAPLISIETGDQLSYGFVFSTGAIPQVTDRIERYRGPDGLSGTRLVTRAIIDATRPGSELLQASPARLHASLPEEETIIDGDHLGTIITTLPGLYMGLDPFWGTQHAPLRVTYAAGDAQGLVPTILGQWAGRKDVRKLRARGFQSFNANSVKIKSQAPVVLDGDPLTGGDYTLRASQPVTFLR